MTYEQDFPRRKYTGTGMDDYQTGPTNSTGGSRWLLIALAIVVSLIAISILVSGPPPETILDSTAPAISESETIQPATPTVE